MILRHSHGERGCPVYGCKREPVARAVLEAHGLRRVRTACLVHIAGIIDAAASGLDPELAEEARQFRAEYDSARLNS